MLARIAGRLPSSAGASPCPSLLGALRLLSGAAGGRESRPARNDSVPSSQAQPSPLPPLPPPLASHEVHWLDRFFPGLRVWLEEKNRHWWIRGLVQARCKEYHQLEGREVQLRQLIEDQYAANMQRFAGRAVDERAETHLQVAALVLASHTALLPWLRDEQEVLKIIGEHMGGRTHALLRFLLRATKFLHRDGYAALSARLRGLQWDLGRGFDMQLQLGPQESTLTVSRCFYHDLFSEAGQPQLAACCCCSQDQVWFESAHYKGVEAGRTAAISAGDPQCCFRCKSQACGRALCKVGSAVVAHNVLLVGALIEVLYSCKGEVWNECSGLGGS